MVRATLKILKEALKNSENEYFILLSDDCIPLFTPEDCFKRVIDHGDNIIYGHTTYHEERYTKLTDKSLLTRHGFDKQSQWMILNRKTVQHFIENDYTKLFEDMLAPDEHYFVNLCHEFDIPFTNKKLCMMIGLINDWPHPHVFKILHLNKLKKSRRR